MSVEASDSYCSDIEDYEIFNVLVVILEWKYCNIPQCSSHSAFQTTNNRALLYSAIFEMTINYTSHQCRTSEGHPRGNFSCRSWENYGLCIAHPVRTTIVCFIIYLNWKPFSFQYIHLQPQETPVTFFKKK